MLKSFDVFRFIRLAARSRGAWFASLVIALGAVVFTIARAKAKFWAMDDAAISYAYARAMAHGTLATFPEGPVVEGYSNPLLCFLVAALYRVGLFDPITTHLWIEALLFGWTLACIFRVLRRRATTWVAVVGVIVFAGCELMTKATWIWYGSGLENMLSTACLATLVLITDRAIEAGPRPWLDGSLLAVTALARPEAAFYSAAAAVALVASIGFSKPDRVQRLVNWFRMVGICALLTALYFVWRWLSYHALLPNTFYAKAHDSGFMLHWQDYVVKWILPYRFVQTFVLSGIFLLIHPRWRSRGLVLALLLAASTLMPAFKGYDWMGDHRFATPLIALSHMTFTLALGAALSLGGQWWSRWLPLRIGGLAGAGVLLWGLFGKDNPLVEPVRLNEVNIGHVAYIQAVQRIEHQRRLGLVNPTVVIPDAGATLLVGGLRLIDSGYLTDFQMARIRNNMRLVDQYQHEEQQSEMAGLNRNPLYNFNWALVGSRFVGHPDQNMIVRRDLVEVSAPAIGTPPLAEVNGVRVFRSPHNVFVAGPDGLVRIEVLVQRDSIESAAQTVASAALAGSQTDEIRLVPYGPLPAQGTERRAFLLTAPHAEGRYDVSLVLRHPLRSSDPVVLGTLEVTRDPSRWKSAAAELISSSPDPREQAWLLVRLREQLPARMSRSEWKAEAAALANARTHNDKSQSELIDRFTWDVRFGTDDSTGRSLAESIADASVRYVLDGRCDQQNAAADRLLCLGRRVQWLRSLGVFGVLHQDRVHRLVDNAERLKRSTDVESQYRALVGLTLLHPGDSSLQGQLAHARAALRNGFRPLSVW